MVLGECSDNMQPSTMELIFFFGLEYMISLSRLALIATSMGSIIEYDESDSDGWCR